MTRNFDVIMQRILLELSNEREWHGRRLRAAQGKEKRKILF
jgi:hypothetical protein